MARFVSTVPAIERFKSRCAFDALTGCVLWTGAKTRGRGHTDWYGSFWFEGKSWLAHRWAAKFIHGQPLEPNLQVDHCCPHGPNTLCVQHLQTIPASLNRELQWIRVQVGLDSLPPVGTETGLVPFYVAPDWITAQVVREPLYAR